MNAIVSKTFYGKVFNVCYCKVSYILPLKVHKKAKHDNCVIISIFKEWHSDHLFSDRNKISRILWDSWKTYVMYVTLQN